MQLLHGQPIRAQDVERETSHWDAAQFASLCNAIVCSASGQSQVFTERVNVGDSGIDAELDVPLDESPGFTPVPFLRSGWNVLEYKKRDVNARPRSEIVSQLKAHLKGALARVIQRAKKRPASYLLFINVHLSRHQSLALRDAIRKECDAGESVYVDVVGAAELAAQLNNLPHLRAAFFSPELFATWKAAWRRHVTLKQLGAKAPFVGREEELARLRSLLDNGRTRAVVIAAPHGMGKSRTVLEATRDKSAHVVVSLDPRSTKPADLTSLVSQESGIVVIVDDPEPGDVRPFIEHALVQNGLKMIATVPSDGQISIPGYERDDRVEVMNLGRLNQSSAEKLLRDANPGLGYSLESWILQNADGNPGLILTAASVGQDLRDDATDFVATVGHAIFQYAEESLGKNTAKALAPLSLLAHVGIRGNYVDELDNVCRCFSYAARDVVNSIGVLTGAGYVNEGGSFVEVTPPILARYLAGRTVVQRPNELLALLANLKYSGRVRLIQRLAQLSPGQADPVWALFFGQDGLFGDLRGICQNAHLLRLLAGAVPPRVARVLTDELSILDVEERQAIQGDERRELVWAIEELVFREETCEGGIRLLFLLGEAENEDIVNSASGVFCECFQYGHPQLPLGLERRLSLLKELAAQEQTVEGRLLAIRAIKDGIDSDGAFPLRATSGLQPFSRRPSMTYGEVRDYVVSLVDLLLVLASCDSDPIANEAASILPVCVAREAFVPHVSSQTVVKRFEQLASWAEEGKPGLDVGAVTDQIVFLAKGLPDVYIRRGKDKDELNTATAKLLELKYQLDHGDFAVRLKQWAGPWRVGVDVEKQEDTGEWRDRYGEELQRLAKEATDNPSQLTGELLSWLRSDQAQKSFAFFRSLGHEDHERKWQARLEEMAGDGSGDECFGAYFGGLSEQDEGRASKRLDQLTAQPDFSGRAIAFATTRARADEGGVKRLELLLHDERVDRVFAGQLMTLGGWLEPLDDPQLVRLLRAVAGSELQAAPSVIDMLGMWLHIKGDTCGLSSMVAGFAEECLAARPERFGHVDNWHYDQIAAKLASEDPERGFRLLDRALCPGHRHERWNPIDQYTQRQFWNSLIAADRPRAIRTVLDAYTSGSPSEFGSSWDIRHVLNQQEDHQILLEYGLKNEDTATFVCDCLKPERPGFVEIADPIIQEFPDSRRVTSTLRVALVQEHQVMAGSQVPYIESRKKRLEELLKGELISPQLREMLNKAVEALEHDSAQQALWDYDIDVNELRQYIETPNSPERIWAIGRLLSKARWEDVQRLLGIEDIADVIDEVDIPEEKRKVIKRALEVWNGDR